ncbi:HYR domain-containing protein [Methylobacter psychrophilus]|uniref:HYR domain-containing protein n=1 Tax=Methylobacter psychrophilus TaxID=96941 RepID=UPI0021D4BB48|nr:HYR domain-containing protein [Methylobacter psychrophilus]
MKTKYAQNNFLWTVCLGTCLPFALANAAPQYSVSDLGSLGGTYSIGLGVNNSGLVSGFSHLVGNTSEHAIVGQALSLPQDLDSLGGSYSQAYSINNLGQVVGSAALLGDTVYHAFQWDGGAAPPLVALKDLKALVASGNSRAFSINDRGQATGFSSTSVGTEHAVIWQNTGVITDLGTLDGTGNSSGSVINATGEVAGFSSLTGNKATHAVLWSSGIKKDLGTLGGSHSAAYGINALGEVAGSATTVLDAAQHAFLWQPNQFPQMKDLGTLGGTFSEAHGISSNSDVVGVSTTANNAVQKAFLWQSGLGLQDLNTLIDPASGWTLMEAQAISEDSRYITGVGMVNGERHAFLLKSQITDATPPKISFLITPSVPGLSGWYQTAPSLTWSVTDLESAISSKIGCTNAPLVSNTTAAGQVFSCAATSTGGTALAINTPSLKVDALPPVFAGVPVAITKAATGLTGAVVTYTAPTAVDTFSGVSPTGVSCAPVSGATFAVGSTPVNCSVSDLAGNSSSASFTVIVADQTAPLISYQISPIAPASGWYKTAPGVAWSVTDAESAISSKVGCSLVPVNGQALSCTATSAGGTNGPIITPVINVDATLPTFVGVPVAITKAATGLTGAVVTYTAPTATDTLSGVSPAGVSCAPTSGATFAIGSTPVNCSVSDLAGNSSSASFTVIVADQTAPLISYQISPIAPASGWYKTAPGVAWSVTDAESAISSKVGCSLVPVNGQALSCTATSAGGTNGPIITPVINVDATLPTFVGVPVAITKAATGLTGAVVTYTAPTATDTLSGVSPAGVSCAPASGATFAIGSTPVNCSVSDLAGNASSANFIVNVAADQTPPLVSYQVTPAAPGASGWYKTAPAIAWSVTDTQSVISSKLGCTDVPLVGNTTSAGQIFSCSATSAGGMAALVTTPGIKVDTTLPTFIGVPAAITKTATGATGAVVTYTAPIATDTFSGVSPASVGCAPASGATFAIGTTPVNCLVSDLAGNSSSASFTVTVANQTLPATRASVSVTKAECRRVSAIAGDWSVEGFSSNSTNNQIQLYSTATVPLNLASNTLSATVPVINGIWRSFQKSGKACTTTPISLRSTATGNILENIRVIVR